MHTSRPPHPSRPRSRRARSASRPVAAAVVGLTAALALPGAAGAAPLTGHQTATRAPGQDDAHRIVDETARVDPATGAFELRVRFAAAQPAVPTDQFFVGLRTAEPARPKGRFGLSAGLDAGGRPQPAFGTSPAATFTAGYDAARTTFTATGVDPTLRGPFTSYAASAQLTSADTLVTYSRVEVPLGPRAPAPRLAPLRTRLVANARGRVTVVVPPLASPAVQSFRLQVPGHGVVGSRELRPSAYRTRRITIRTGSLRLRRAPRTATLSRRATITNGSTRVATRRVTLRRR